MKIVEAFRAIQEPTVTEIQFCTNCFGSNDTFIQSINRSIVHGPSGDVLQLSNQCPLNQRTINPSIISFSRQECIRDDPQWLDLPYHGAITTTLLGWSIKRCWWYVALVLLAMGANLNARYHDHASLVADGETLFMLLLRTPSTRRFERPMMLWLACYFLQYSDLNLSFQGRTMVFFAVNSDFLTPNCFLIHNIQMATRELTFWPSSWYNNNHHTPLDEWVHSMNAWLQSLERSTDPHHKHTMGQLLCDRKTWLRLIITLNIKTPVSPNSLKSFLHVLEQFLNHCLIPMERTFFKTAFLEHLNIILDSLHILCNHAIVSMEQSSKIAGIAASCMMSQDAYQYKDFIRTYNAHLDPSAWLTITHLPCLMAVLCAQEGANDALLQHIIKHFPRTFPYSMNAIADLFLRHFHTYGNHYTYSQLLNIGQALASWPRLCYIVKGAQWNHPECSSITNADLNNLHHHFFRITMNHHATLFNKILKLLTAEQHTVKWRFIGKISRLNCSVKKLLSWLNFADLSLNTIPDEHAVMTLLDIHDADRDHCLAPVLYRLLQQGQSGLACAILRQCPLRVRLSFVGHNALWVRMLCAQSFTVHHTWLQHTIHSFFRYNDNGYNTVMIAAVSALPFVMFILPTLYIVLYPDSQHNDDIICNEIVFKKS
jgi:hypothetical protein